MSNHLGNVLAVVGDFKVQDEQAVEIGGVFYDVPFYRASIVQLTDYYPFGIACPALAAGEMPGRRYLSGRYRFGFNGQEHDDELFGEGNAVSFKYRVHDARLGRFLSVDPLAPEYPWNSTYAFAENDVIRAMDLEGAEKGFQTGSDPEQITLTTGEYENGIPASAGSATYSDGKLQAELPIGAVDGVNTMVGQTAVEFDRKAANVALANEKAQRGNGTISPGYVNRADGTYVTSREALGEGGRFIGRFIVNPIPNRVGGGSETFYNLAGEEVGAGEMLATNLLFLSGVGEFAGARAAANGLRANLYRRGGNTGAFSELVVPMQMRVVKKVANQAGVGLRGVMIRIERNPELIGREIFGFADRRTITLYPDAFSSYENLVRTLGHERTHIFQIKLYGRPSNTLQLKMWEDAAWGIENAYWNFYLKNR